MPQNRLMEHSTLLARRLRSLPLCSFGPYWIEVTTMVRLHPVIAWEFALSPSVFFSPVLIFEVHLFFLRNSFVHHSAFPPPLGVVTVKVDPLFLSLCPPCLHLPTPCRRCAKERSPPFFFPALRDHRFAPLFFTRSLLYPPASVIPFPLLPDFSLSSCVAFFCRWETCAPQLRDSLLKVEARFPVLTPPPEFLLFLSRDFAPLGECPFSLPLGLPLH